MKIAESRLLMAGHGPGTGDAVGVGPGSVQPSVRCQRQKKSSVAGVGSALPGQGCAQGLAVEGSLEGSGKGWLAGVGVGSADRGASLHQAVDCSELVHPIASEAGCAS